MRRPRITKAIADELGGLAGAFEENAKAGRPEITGDDLPSYVDTPQLKRATRHTGKSGEHIYRVTRLFERTIK